MELKREPRTGDRFWLEDPPRLGKPHRVKYHDAFLPQYNRARFIPVRVDRIDGTNLFVSLF